jgi:hypothetical protein
MALSRYRKCKLLNNGTNLSIPVIDFSYTDNDVYYYQVKSHDRLDILALEDFGNESYFWILARMNKISFFFDLKAGMKILRPKNPSVFLNQI